MFLKGIEKYQRQIGLLTRLVSVKKGRDTERKWTHFEDYCCI